jgi:acetyl esterase/lipase
MAGQYPHFMGHSYPARLRQFTAVPPEAFRIIRYGAEAGQIGELWGAGRASHPAPVVALIHGGYWRERYRLDVMHALAADLSSRGYAVWNIEYRRLGMNGGGWPGTFADIASGIDALAGFAGEYGLDTTRLMIIGHSAGGHLALWSAARQRLQGSWSHPRTTARHVVSLAGVCDLVTAAHRRLSNGAVIELLGGSPEDVPEIYAQACPMLLLPLRIRHTVVHGTSDIDVPFELSANYAGAARRAGDQCVFLPEHGSDHFDLIDPASPAWASISRLILA